MSTVTSQDTQPLAAEERLVAAFTSSVNGGEERLETAGRLLVTSAWDSDTILAGPLLYTLDAAASFLELPPGELRLALQHGVPLAELAVSRDRNADGMVAAMIDDARERLDGYVSAGVLAPDQRDRLLNELDQRIGELVAEGAPSGP